MINTDVVTTCSDRMTTVGEKEVDWLPQEQLGSRTGHCVAVFVFSVPAWVISCSHFSGFRKLNMQ